MGIETASGVVIGQSSIGKAQLTLAFAFGFPNDQ
jgi:hypothetical protein